MITFNGSQKEFFKAYPKEKRSLDEVYKLINSTGETVYKFIKTTGEKNFKKVSEKELTNETEKKDDSKASSKTVELKSTPKNKSQEKVNEKEEVTKTVTKQSVKTKEKVVSRKEEICNRLEEIFTNAIERAKHNRKWEEDSSPPSMNYVSERKCYYEQCEKYLRAARICVRNDWLSDINSVTSDAISYSKEHVHVNYLDEEWLNLVKEIRDNDYFGTRTKERCNCCYKSEYESHYDSAIILADDEMLKERLSEGRYEKLEKYSDEFRLKYLDAAVREIKRCYERIEHLEDLLKQVEDIAKTRDSCPK